MNHLILSHLMPSSLLLASRNTILGLISVAAILLAGCSNPNIDNAESVDTAQGVDVAQGTVERDAPLNAEISSKLQTILDTALADGSSKYPGVILRFETPKGTWNGVSGVSNIKTKSSIDALSKFRAGSIIKPFIVTVILQLVEEGKLSLDDRLTSLLSPKYTKHFEYSDNITVKMLLNHTSGIGDWTGNAEEEVALYETIFRSQQHLRVWPVEEYLKMAGQNGSDFKPGESWQYNNTEYNILGMIIEKITGNTWRDNIRKRILSKLELKNTVLPEDGDITMPGAFVRGYANFNGVLTDTTDIEPSLAGAAGGHSLVTNTQDLSVFMKALLNGVFFEKQESLSNMMTFVEADGPGSYYGLGIMRIDFPNDSYGIGHTGMTAGYISAVMYLPKEDITVSSVITSHQGSGITEYVLPSLQVLVEHLQSQ